MMRNQNQKGDVWAKKKRNVVEAAVQASSKLKSVVYGGELV